MGGADLLSNCEGAPEKEFADCNPTGDESDQGVLINLKAGSSGAAAVPAAVSAACPASQLMVRWSLMRAVATEAVSDV